MGKRLLRLAKVVLRGNAGTGAMFFPFMLDQAAAGHKVQHVVHGRGRHRVGARAGHRRRPAAGLRPQAVKDEGFMPSDSALAGMVAGMAGTVVRRPGKCEQVIVELSATLGRVFVMTVMPGKGGRRESENRTNES